MDHVPKAHLLTPDSGPAEILAVARRCPALARAIYRSVDPSSGAAWPAVFCRFPRWERLDATLADASTRRLDADVLRCAATTSMIAAETRWYSHERAFWAVLVETEPRNRQFKRCLAAARRLLQENPEGKFFFHLELDVAPALEPVKGVRFRSPVARLLKWSSTLRKQLKNLAAVRSLQTALKEREIALGAATAATWEKLGRAVLRLTELATAGPAAAWLSTGGEGGLGFLNAVGAAFAGPLSLFECHRLPAYFRSSADLTHEGVRLGKLYFHRRLAPSLPWVAAVAAGAARLRMQAGLQSAKRRDEQSIERLSKQAQARLRSAIAEFAAGAGHEINNPLGAIAGTVEMLLPDERAPARRTALIKIRDQVDRVHGMIRDLHFIGRTQRAEQRPLRLAEALAEAAAAVAARPIGRFSLAPIAEDWRIVGCQREVVRVFQELFANAIEAAGRIGSVRVTCTLTSASTRLAVVTIVDSGPGFTAENRRHAFTPFYSGRSAGRGLGMGLPVVRRIAEDHGALFEIDDGTPTTVRIAFPLLEVEAARRAA